MTSLWPLMEGKLDFLLRPSIYIGSSIIMYAFLPDSCCVSFAKKWEEDNFDNSDSRVLQKVRTSNLFIINILSFYWYCK